MTTVVETDALPGLICEGVGVLEQWLAVIREDIAVGFAGPSPREALWRVINIGRAVAVLCKELGLPQPPPEKLGLSAWPCWLAPGSDDDGHGNSWEG